MVEQGLVLHIQQGLGSPPSVVASGGFFGGQLPPNQITQAAPMAWAYRSITSTPEYLLSGQSDFTEWTVQIDCHGYTAADAVNLARAIDRVLRGGFTGSFPDPDGTFVFGLFRLPGFVDGYSDANRSYVRSLEYTIQYRQI